MAARQKLSGGIPNGLPKAVDDKSRVKILSVNMRVERTRGGTLHRVSDGTGGIITLISAILVTLRFKWSSLLRSHGRASNQSLSSGYARYRINVEEIPLIARSRSRDRATIRDWLERGDDVAITRRRCWETRLKTSLFDVCTLLWLLHCVVNGKALDTRLRRILIVANL